MPGRLKETKPSAGMCRTLPCRSMNCSGAIPSCRVYIGQNAPLANASLNDINCDDRLAHGNSPLTSVPCPKSGIAGSSISVKSIISMARISSMDRGIVREQTGKSP